MKKDDKKSILIFGVSSFVGSNLAEFFANDYRVIGTYYTNPVQIKGVLTIPCNILKPETVKRILYSFMPDYTIYAIGSTSLSMSAKSSQTFGLLNTTGLFNVTRFSARYKSQIIYISSAYVFSGEKKNNIEIDIPDPNTTYGESKSTAEFYLQKSSFNFLVFRCCSLYGRSMNPIQKTWFEYLQEKMFNNQFVSVDDRIEIGHIDILYLAMIIKISLQKDLRNRLFQVSSIDSLSYYNFARLYCRIFGDNDQLISKTSWKFPIISKTRGKRKSSGNREYGYRLGVSNVENFLNIKLPSVKESLEFTLRRFNGDYGKHLDSDPNVSYI